ncbi:hypothetical protein [Aquimarina pacifica]|uniref:hypothetical protein n=1 Tax=Aquimarina pacifica TaxID=1296415 RepID=UPI00046F3CA3|nr:hypothetical protein [Aquimarina pacifica]
MNKNCVLKRTIPLIVFFIVSIGCNNVVRVESHKNTDIRDSDLTEPTNYNRIKNCEEGQELAKKELREGKIKYIFGGFGNRQNLPKKLKELYEIEIITVEGVLGIPNKCYNDIMYAEIQKKFGKDAFNKAMEN